MSFLHTATQKNDNSPKSANIRALHKSRRLKKVSKFLIVLVFLSISVASHAQYHQVLPKGVRAIINKNISSEISSTYNQSGGVTPIKYKVEADIETLESINNEDVQSVLEVFKKYPSVYPLISGGTHQVDGEADVNVNVFAFGYGITDRLMAYVGLPIYEARVTMKYKKIKGSSQDDVAAALQDITNDGEAQALGAVVEKLYDIDGATIQSGFTNALGYNELGNWHGQGLGDIEFGLAYVLYVNDYHGMKLTFGGVAPTGYVDDPDTLQDVGFGNGQWDAFVEIGGGLSITEDTSVDLWTRYTYQFASDKRLRVPFEEGLGISDESQDVEEKLGNKYMVGVSMKHHFNDWFSLKPTFTYEFQESSSYSSDNKRANKLLAYNTDSSAQNLKLAASFSSTRLFQQKKFLLPGEVNFSYQTVVGGYNTPNSDLLELEFVMFF